jgi:hypothetical protein
LRYYGQSERHGWLFPDVPRDRVTNPARDFNDALLALDRALTGKEAPATSELRSVRLEDWEWIDRELYLSDGGYSRVVFSLDTGRLFLTSNSLDSTKARWDSALEERRAVEGIARGQVEGAREPNPARDHGLVPRRSNPSPPNAVLVGRLKF